MTSDRTLISRAPVAITVAGTRILLPYRPAADWAVVIESVSALAGTLAEPADRERLADLLMEHPDAATDMRAESLRILAEQSGWKWWEAGRLIATSLGREILGRLTLAGLDPHQRSLGEWCAATYALCTKGQDEKGRIRFDFHLSLPPPGYHDEWDDEGDDPAAIMQAVQAMTGKR